ncbi:IPT/TIG domain-containing protein [Acidipila rosea]|uniref:IPT/TIG domain-containing protein n=2 Tax=Acidipila rosea TaxID=768535 RepID=A0A4R1KXK6_9BACT|nr:IPT/TIG domain-containing protein [Acidipila rosea]
MPRNSDILPGFCVHIVSKLASLSIPGLSTYFALTIPFMSLLACGGPRQFKTSGIASSGAPYISTFSPASASPGMVVHLTGLNLQYVDGVTVNGIPVDFTLSGPTRLSFIISKHATTGPISVYATQGQSTTKTSLKVNPPPPAITAVAPTSGPGGTVVEITGTGFNKAKVVALNRVQLAFSVVNDGQILAQIPAEGTTGSITVTTPEGIATSNEVFNVQGNAALAFWASQPVKPNETVLVSGANISPDATVEVARLPDDNPGDPTLSIPPEPSDWTSVSPLQVSASSIKFVIPATDENGVFAYRLKTHGGSITSATYLVNRPDVWFIQGDQGRTASPSGWLRIFGNSLSILGSNQLPQIALVSNGVVVETINADPGFAQNAATASYAESYAIPPDMPAGDYQLYVHNGAGGPAAWTRFSSFGPGAAPDFTNVIPQPISTISIMHPSVWPQVVYRVAPPHPDGSPDDDSFAVANAWAKVNHGGIIQIPGGSYHLRASLLLPNHTLLTGAGKAETVLNFSGGEPLISGAKLNSWGLGLFSVENLTIAAPEKTSGSGIFMAYMPTTESSSHVFARNVKILLANTDSGHGSATGIILRQIQNVEITNADIDAPSGIIEQNSVFHVRIENCNLFWRYGTISMGSVSQDMIISNNRYTLRGNAMINGYGNNPNPGFWFAAYSSPYVRDLYYANNTSTSEQSFSPGEPGFYGITSDGDSVVYFGQVASVSGTSLHLAGPTLPIINGAASAKTPSAFWTGGVVMVVSGRGTGQYRIVTSNTPGSPDVMVNAPWDVPPDASSIVSICAFEGRALFVNNDFGMDPTDQDYYMSHDVIHANNIMESATGQNFLGFKNGKVGTGIIPGWHIQAIGNHIANNSGEFLSSALQSSPAYSGFAASQQIIRDNVFADGIKGFIRGQASSANLSDVIIENNTTPLISILTTGNGQISNLLIRNNQINASAGGEPQLQLPANHKGVLVVPQS